MNKNKQNLKDSNAHLLALLTKSLLRSSPEHVNEDHLLGISLLKSNVIHMSPVPGMSYYALRSPHTLPSLSGGILSQHTYLRSFLVVILVCLGVGLTEFRCTAMAGLKTPYVAQGGLKLIAIILLLRIEITDKSRGFWHLSALSNILSVPFLPYSSFSVVANVRTHSLGNKRPRSLWVLYKTHLSISE